MKTTLSTKTTTIVTILVLLASCGQVKPEEKNTQSSEIEPKFNLSNRNETILYFKNEIKIHNFIRIKKEFYNSIIEKWIGDAFENRAINLSIMNYDNFKMQGYSQLIIVSNSTIILRVPNNTLVTNILKQKNDQIFKKICLNNNIVPDEQNDISEIISKSLLTSKDGKSILEIQMFFIYDQSNKVDLSDTFPMTQVNVYDLSFRKKWVYITFGQVEYSNISENGNYVELVLNLPETETRLLVINNKTNIILDKKNHFSSIPQQNSFSHDGKLYIYNDKINERYEILDLKKELSKTLSYKNSNNFAVWVGFQGNDLRIYLRDINTGAELERFYDYENIPNSLGDIK